MLSQCVLDFTQCGILIGHMPAEFAITWQYFYDNELLDLRIRCSGGAGGGGGILSVA